ncbi:MAG: DUF1540 domain-containing protein [Clostridia bacterium]|nr:DUF1540 domain-containing protein [Clostridia bacterium]
MQNAKNETRECISCDVRNCVYHTMEDTCAAGRIQVGHGEASSCHDTCCDTFSAKESQG